MTTFIKEEENNIEFDFDSEILLSDAENTEKEVENKKNTKKRKSKAEKKDKPSKKQRKVAMSNKMLYPKVKVLPRSGYQFFMIKQAELSHNSEHTEDESVSSPNEKRPTKLQLWAQKWRSLSEEEKSVFTQMAVDDKKRYFDEVRECGYEIVDKSKLRRPGSAFLLFSRDKQKAVREEHGITYKEALIKIGEMWNDPHFSLEKEQYMATAKKLKEEWDAQRLASKEEEENTQNSS